MLPAQARLRRRPEFTTVVRSGRRAGRPTMVLHLIPERPEQSGSSARPEQSGSSARPEQSGSSARPEQSGGSRVPPSGARAGFVVGKAVGNSVVRHRVTRRLRAVVAAELHRLPASADLVVRARPEAADAESAVLHCDLVAGLDRLLGDRVTQR